ncbi:daunorubicin resistance ABC transporteraTP-binding subunit [groundwater metagenome]
MNAIKTENITKKYGDLIAVNNISLSINKGEIFGLLGPNGAGKTTMIKMLATLLKPTSGLAEVWGYNVLSEQDAVRKSIGIVFQNPSLDIELTGRENLNFHARIYNLGKDLRKKRIDEVLHLVELRNKADVFVKNYSGGMQRRLEIARGLMHYPNVLFLDEPTLGLDAQTRRSVWEYIKRLNKEEKITVVLTTHYMEEADYLCDRVAIIDHGRVIALDSPDNLKNSIGKDIISLQVTDGKNFLNTLKAFDFIKGMELRNESLYGSLYLSVEDGERMIPRIMDLAHKEAVIVQSVGLHKPTLEDVFLHFTGRTIREQDTGKKEHIQRMVRAGMMGTR